MKKYLLGLVAFLSFTLVSFIPQSTSEVPSVTIKGLSGENVDFSSVVKKGRVTVVSFWATWCVPCKKEINAMSELIPEWQKTMDFDMIAVSIDDTRNMAKVKSYVNGQKWEFPAYIDPNQDLKRALNFQSIPFAIIFDKDGKIAYTHSGYVEGDEFVLRDHIKEIVSAK
jgi:cytochrome c biogenesis protein CcmG/thiol:disulfide interchange protein DsbE